MQKDLEEMTPLHLATRHKSPKCLALLLKFMAPGEVDTQDKNKVMRDQHGGQKRQNGGFFLTGVTSSKNVCLRALLFCVLSQLLNSSVFPISEVKRV